MLAAAERLLLAEAGRGGPEEFLKERGGAVFIGIGQGRTARRFGDPQMDESPQAARQTVADLAQGIRASQLTEQHGDELCPAGKALGVTLSGVLFYECGELGSGKVLKQLIE